MPSFRDAFRQGRDQARARRGAEPLARRLHYEDRSPSSAFGEAAAGDDWDEAQYVEDAAGSADATESPDGIIDDPQTALRQCQAELAEALRLVRELTDYVELTENRVIELIAEAEPMAKALRLPGVKTFLLQRFHPDKYPGADEKQRALLTEALKTINTAYARADELQASDSSGSP